MPRRQARGIILPGRRRSVVIPKGFGSISAQERQLLMCLTPRGATNGYAQDAISGFQETDRAGGGAGTHTSLYDTTMGWHALRLACPTGGTINKRVGNIFFNHAENIVNMLEPDRAGLTMSRGLWGTLELEGYCAVDLAITASPSTHPGYAFWGFLSDLTAVGSFDVLGWLSNNGVPPGVGFFAHQGGNWWTFISKRPLNAYPTSVFYRLQDTGVAWDGYIRHLSLSISGKSGSYISWKIDGTAVGLEQGPLTGFQFDNENSPIDPQKFGPSWMLWVAALNDSADMWVHMGAGTRLWLEE